jgi:hypothetical protein
MLFVHQVLRESLATTRMFYPQAAQEMPVRDVIKFYLNQFHPGAKNTKITHKNYSGFPAFQRHFAGINAGNFKDAQQGFYSRTLHSDHHSC